MEINAINQLRRTAVRAEEWKLEAQEDVSASSGTPAKTDSISLADRAVAELKEQHQRIMDLLQQDQEDEEFPMLWGLGGSENESSEAEILSEQLKAAERCQKIAARIMRGDKVPPEDERYLMENDPDGYKLALAARTPKKNPKEWESVLKDEEKKTSSESSEETSGEASCEEAGGTSGTGGEAGGDAGSAPEGGQ